MNLVNTIKGIVCAAVALCLSQSVSYAQATPDPALMGTYAVTKAQYDLGDQAWTPPSFPFAVEVRGSVHYPTGLSGGPFPVIVFLHGRHETCYQTSNPSNTNGVWPCPTGWQSITSYEGYDYAARTMASHGYIVISVSCNSINADDNSLADAGMNARGELMQHHLDLWNTYNTTGAAPFGTTFVGKLDLQNIGTMGHSRGGEGVIFHALYNKSLGSPYGIKAVITLAPVDFLRKVMHDIPLMNIAPYCDGDVSDLQGVHFYDDARYTDTMDLAPKHSVLMMGANHNFYNTVWTPGSYIAGGADDWDDYWGGTDPHCKATVTGNKRFDTTKQKAAFNSYAAAFYRMYVGKETQFAPILEADDRIPPSSSLLDTTNVFVSFQPGRHRRLDINRADTNIADVTNSLGGAVTITSLTSPDICSGGLGMLNCLTGVFAGQEPHRGSSTEPGAAQMRLRWNAPTNAYENAVPAANQDVTSFQYLSFRAGVNFKDYTGTAKLNYTVQLIDSAGNTASLAAGSYTSAMFRGPGTETGNFPKVTLNTVKIPLSDFTGINLAKIRKVKFLFNNSAAGAILVNDIAFTGYRCGKLNANYNDSTAFKSYKVFFKDSSVTNFGDTVTYLWKFGNPASGVNDTSTLKNPTHTYTGPGTYTACLYVTTKRKFGVSCTDTFCQTIVLTPLSVEEMNHPEITIIPNPAKDYLQIDGAEKTDVLRIINLYGQEVFSTAITQSYIQLPQNLATGVYYAIINTAKGNIHQKILINR